MRPLLIALALLAGCAGSLETKTRTALDAIALTVQPAYTHAMALCVDQEQATVLSARMGHTTPDEALNSFEGISQRCHRTRAAFEAIKSLHESAAELLEAGKLSEAEQVLSELEYAWAALRGDHK